ncbi:TIGR03086 family protein [Cryobacterium sp. TMT2-15-1]|uniref:TIGR03086 family metal-binding protein n=1 Tax=Cryobacterium sp. TMT2-15-1 TaxID=1259246 RepID=UPI00106C6520|nr:TIGR03086 family metal-binding protein [Cryobacterium sp. TMT2-15-1]TFC61213.1 TIGR03086 family protein [Cryobacterium sp. TMT2-15-1]
MTYDWLALQKRAAEEFGARVDLITDWAAATPDTEWTVTELVRHVVLEQQWVPALLRGLTVLDARRSLTPLGPDLAKEWAIYSALAAAAWATTPADAPVTLSYDTVTASDYLREQVSDVTIHSWDLARATAADESLDPALIEAVWTVFEPQRDTLEASGLFATPVPSDENAPLQTRLLALTGRDPRRP